VRPPCKEYVVHEWQLKNLETKMGKSKVTYSLKFVTTLTESDAQVEAIRNLKKRIATTKDPLTLSTLYQELGELYLEGENFDDAICAFREQTINSKGKDFALANAFDKLGLANLMKAYLTIFDFTFLT
jgi:predicted negative regulator of RcsB-dependent stress response